MRSRTHQRTGSLLALLAMLLITFAPMVSQLIAANTHDGVPLAELCSAHAASGDAASGHHSPDALSQFDGKACGYCHFFAHTPVVPGASASFALDVPAARAIAVARTEIERPAQPFTTAQPRAPPVLI
ncbi:MULTISPECIES: DUF2946 domain-containing protein [unclassified Caballeronia]|uniref:DUF2946 domain-containing protein n=1 Tax=unclassified Caballeronia TaxID=2646786 RepID=UPI00285E6050|nr:MULTISPECIES: DUF2946 domain-containing protein [unclassified Caballeronia]MDR5773505.1 DUF2946 domain-containing protein [Caballeronia sp. LZ002]MDR5848939.1 DUF2946 domain-containing protein [Caballeronia sp. LZ003]